MTIRISDDLRDQLDEFAQLEEVSTSELIRKVLDEYCNSIGSSEDKGYSGNRKNIKVIPELEIDYEENYNDLLIEVEEIKSSHEEIYQNLKEDFNELQNDYDELLNEEIDIVDSKEFLQLLCWVYYQRSGSIMLLSNEQYKRFQETIIKIHSSIKISGDLKNEFNKVFVDLINIENSSFFKNTQLSFSKGVFPKFNYSLLNDFIYKNHCDINSIKFNL